MSWLHCGAGQISDCFDVREVGFLFLFFLTPARIKSTDAFDIVSNFSEWSDKHIIDTRIFRKTLPSYQLQLRCFAVLHAAINSVQEYECSSILWLKARHITR